ncbi:flagellin FliC [Candidatus Poribacteria bacterium]|jgi:flagellin|nr:flagellin FliC [Candidatus Poribacteria bacterium]MBT5536504.1 flagellin FliC [Candidatus Poribacteria bacterium]MBT5711048.1 flagellin FliC [Candidatus Poribacteria bacterium]MBT7098696.1 flagellin FliC [Candidatus Poribacteria bacterium]MBT7804850.1 flagellin FliC [Candidatus Poribacteria bacterium]
MFRINTNIAALTSRRHLNGTDRDVRTAIERMSSGMRINRAVDDAAGMFISEQMRGQIAAFKQARQNISQAVSLLQVMEGGLDQLTSIMIRLKELAIQAADGSYTDSQRRNGIQVEGEQLVQELDRILTGVRYNGITLFDPPPTVLTFQIGDSSTDRLGLGIVQIDSDAMLGDYANRFASLGGTLNSAYADVPSIPDFLDQIATAIDLVVSTRARIGAFQSRLERSSSNIELQIENTQNAESVIRDADLATETSALVRAQILIQAGTAVMNQANLLPQNVLSLLNSIS